MEESRNANADQNRDQNPKRKAETGEPEGVNEGKMPKRGRKMKEKEKFDETNYRIENGLRHVIPYVYHYKANAKKRWFGRSIFEVFTTEFGAHPPSYYRAAIQSGRITVNDQNVEEGYLIKNGDVLLHTTHRHEPPVAAPGPVTVVGETEEYLAVDKPCGVPMHPCGAYRYNSLFYILHKQIGPEVAGWHLCYRLDRLTSGLCVLAKSAALKAAFAAGLADRLHKKVYLARVKGDFPKCAPEGSVLAAGESVAEDPNEDARSWWREETGPWPPGSGSGGGGGGGGGGGAEPGREGATAAAAAAVRVHTPLRCKNHREGVWEVSNEDKFKVAETVFKKIYFDGNTSLVEALPITGRTHQIRLHLQWMGHPIANDPNYGGELFWGEDEKRERYKLSRDWMDSQSTTEFGMGKTYSLDNDQEEAPDKLSQLTEHNNESSTTISRSDQNGTKCSNKANHDQSEEIQGNPTIRDDDLCPRLGNESEEQFLARTCRFCKRTSAEVFNENHLHATGIWLHALKYESGNKKCSFKTPPPSWATDMLAAANPQEHNLLHSSSVEGASQGQQQGKTSSPHNSI